MRIVSGKHKGRPLSTPKGRNTRPTSDRAREAIFNVLEHGITGPGFQDARVMDVFAGTGALGLEALSRGARQCTFVENNRGARLVLQKNIQDLNESGSAKVLEKKATAIGDARYPCAYAFLDAPYDNDLSVPALTALARGGWLDDGCVVMVEVGKSEPLDVSQGFELIKEKNYGAARAVFLIYRP